MTVDLTQYRQQAINFLQSLSIKFSPIADAYNTSLQSLGYLVDLADPTTWKYYLNLQGLYHPADELMYITSLDTLETIEFTVANLTSNPRTLNAYVPGSTYFTNLCNQYPNQTDLIKSILFPCTMSVTDIINADDFTILSYGTQFLEDTELYYIIQELQNTLAYINNRWYFNFLSYEPYFYWTFWGMLWQILLQSIFTSRVKAIKTINVHSWHIWQYLASLGIGDYSNILNRQQALFLYKNINYIIANRGKQSNLVILVDNILDQIGVTLFGRDVYQETADGVATASLTPQLVAVQIPSQYAESTDGVSPETVSDLNIRLISAGDENNSSVEYVNSLIDKMSTTTLNTYPTKVVEIRPIQKNKEFADFLNMFVLDTLVYTAINKVYTTNIQVYNPVSGLGLNVTILEALTLFYYAIQMSERQVPDLIPTVYSCYTAFRTNPLPIPKTFTYLGTTYYTQNMVNLDLYVGSQPYYPSSGIIDPSTFSNVTSTLFLQAVTQITESRLSFSLASSKAMNYVTACTNYIGNINLDLIPGITTYTEWFNLRSDIFEQIITPINEQNDPYSYYSNLSNQILAALIPMNRILLQYGNFNLTDNLYTQLKNLFIQLCSYNITFLDTNRDNGQYLYITDTAIIPSNSYQAPDAFLPTSDITSIENIYNDTLDMPDTDDFLINQLAMEFNIKSIETNTVKTENVYESTIPFAAMPDMTDTKSTISITTMLDTTFGFYAINGKPLN